MLTEYRDSSYVSSSEGSQEEVFLLTEKGSLRSWAIYLLKNRKGEKVWRRGSIHEEISIFQYTHHFLISLCGFAGSEVKQHDSLEPE